MSGNGNNNSNVYLSQIQLLKKKEQKEVFPEDHFQNLLGLSLVLQYFLPPKVKRCVNRIYEHGIYQLPHKLKRDFKI